MNTQRSQILLNSDNADNSKFIQDRICSVEKHTGDLCEALGIYTKQAARFRDRTDDLVECISQYAQMELVNHTLKSSLQGFANCFSTIADHRDAAVRRLETHVVGSFAPFGSQCKDVKEEIKLASSAKARESTRQKQVEKLKQRNPRNRQKILVAETDLARASADVSRTFRSLEEHMNAFESHKLSMTTGALRNMLQTELALHVREVELLTKAYSQLALVDEAQDLESFRSAVRCPPKELSGKGDLRTTLRTSLSGLFSTSSSSLGNATASETPSSPHAHTVLLHQDDDDDEEDDLETLSSEESSSSQESPHQIVKQNKLVSSKISK